MITTINNKHNKLNVPNLRFPEFEGEWRRSKFKKVITLQRGSSPRPIIKYITTSTDGVNWIKIGDMPHFGRIVTSTEEKITREGAKKSRLVKKGDLILSNSMSYGLPYIMGVDGYIHDGWFVLKDFEDTFDKDYLCNLLISSAIQNQYKRLAAGGVVQNISSDLVNSVSVSIPLMEEQKKISSLLNLIDDRIATQNKIIDKLQSLIKGIRNKLFENDKDWRKAKIREFLCIGNGKDYKHLDIGDIPVYGTGGKMLSVNDFLYDGDSVCIGRKGTIDTPLFLTGKFWTVDTLFYTYGFKDVLPKFCYYLFKQINWQLYNEGTGVPSLSKSTIENIKVRIPSIIQQYKICYILDCYEDKIKNEGLILDLYCSQKQYLLRQMFV